MACRFSNLTILQDPTGSFRFLQVPSGTFRSLQVPSDNWSKDTCNTKKDHFGWTYVLVCKTLTSCRKIVMLNCRLLHLQHIGNSMRLKKIVKSANKRKLNHHHWQINGTKHPWKSHLTIQWMLDLWFEVWRFWNSSQSLCWTPWMWLLWKILWLENASNLYPWHHISWVFAQIPNFQLTRFRVNSFFAS